MVDTPSDIGGPVVPSPEQVQAWNTTLFERTHRAASAGAELVVWTEAATLVEPAEESDWRKRVSRLAKEAGVELVVAYVVPLSWAPLRYENKLVWLRPDGSSAHDYLKHIPVPGEPAVPGAGPMHIVQTAFGRGPGHRGWALGRQVHPVGLVCSHRSCWPARRVGFVSGRLEGRSPARSGAPNRRAHPLHRARRDGRGPPARADRGRHVPRRASIHHRTLSWRLACRHRRGGGRIEVLASPVWRICCI